MTGTTVLLVCTLVSISIAVILVGIMVYPLVTSNDEITSDDKKEMTDFDKAMKVFAERKYNSVYVLFSIEGVDFEITVTKEKVEFSRVREGECVKITFHDNEKAKKYYDAFIKLYTSYMLAGVLSIDRCIVEDIGSLITIIRKDDTYIYTTKFGRSDKENDSSDGGNRTNTNRGEPSVSELQKLCKSFKLPPDATYDDFKKKYRTLCKKYHPDVFGSDKVMKSINITFERVEIYFGKK